MHLGEILEHAAIKDLSVPNKSNRLIYQELIKDDKFCIKFSCSKFEEATIEVEVPFTGLESEKNYARLYFLSMTFNAAIHGLKRMKHKKNKQ